MTTKTMSQADVVEAIRGEIRASRLIPGQRLVEGELSELLGTSRATVRAALMDLAKEGLVERVANRGARVRVVGLDEALHMAEARLVVERLCVQRATERLSDAQIAEMRALLERLGELARSNDIQGFAAATNQIREIYLDAADQPVARGIISRLRDQMAGHTYRLTYRPGRPQATLPYWEALVSAFARRDAAAAGAAVEAHVANVRETMRSIATAPSILERGYGKFG
ncbi:GntR family transcriptional regulator [Mangrovicoccus sp. HB161399]|uniref:GntR family transcriptional regulator n=1 Tax=Mangrovicoccus sp. HB161399 TaxID=2720392 RepID=UPI001554D4EE|nr:GntR family transcriptional regulator [Mangrovicoccus sp. HB161399]